MSYPNFTVPKTVIPYLCAKVQQATGGFPVRRAYAVGQNYAAHAKEMGAVARDSAAEPFYFGKPADAIFYPENGVLPFPGKTTNFQYEGELVLAIGVGGSDIKPEDAYKHIIGYAVGIDMTRRDLQTQFKNTGRPWDFAKAFDYSGPVSPIVFLDPAPKSNSDLIADAKITTTVNGEVKQSSNINDMITSIPNLVSYLSQYVALQPGDVIFTGTPEGVGKVVPGDVITVAVEGVTELKVTLQ
jgi:fumarylpyruvate hydrolase